MWVSMKLNIHLQRFLRFQTVNNNSIKYIRNLHNLRNSRNVLIVFNVSSVHLNQYPPLNFNNVNKFSTTSTLLKTKDRGKEKKKLHPVQVNLSEIAELTNVDRMVSQFDKAVEDFKDQLIKHVSLRTNVGAIEELTIEFEDQEYKLQELVEIIRKPKMIVMNISTFPQTIPTILDTLMKSQMNLNPQQEGTTLYIPIPKVTKEHREQLAKRAKGFFVKCKDAITDIRNKHVKDAKKKDKAPKDLVFKAETYISSLSHTYIGKAETLLETKQKELLGEE
ncbi:mitochondrial ribosome recycling factor 1 [Calliopsis andreniformis]|uniref:mitochondrial ribosome recycling factor 1 n=1 Tax=Calliopsis andreniformis TaxID=337506 RepID=UPI003FCC75DB